MEKDCCFTQENRWFRYRAVSVIIEECYILLASNDEYLYSIGGGVHMGETSEDAVKREVKEETGIDYEIDRFIGVHENFFRDELIGDYDCHEVALYYLMKSQGRKSLPENGEAVWIPINEIDKHNSHIDFIKAYLKSNQDFLHLVTIDDGSIKFI